MAWTTIAILLCLSTPAFGQSLRSLFRNVKASKISELKPEKLGTYEFRVKQDIPDISILAAPDFAVIYPKALTEVAALKSAILEIHEIMGCKSKNSCGTISSADRQNTILWTFARNGWAQATASYLSLLTYTERGVGHSPQPVLVLTWTVEVNALNTDSADTFDVVIELANVQRLALPNGNR